jgi:uncharacterized membrane protein required for colicin V production
MTDIVQVDYNVLAYMIVGVFGLVGFFRGWWKEAITAGLITLLLVMLMVPSLATVIVGALNTVVDTVWNFIQSLRQSSPAVASVAQAGPPPDVDPQRYWVYVFILVALVLASYFIGRIGLTEGMSAGSRLLGGVVGFYNGFIAVSLLREFVIGRYLPGASAAAASATPPSSVSVQVMNMPQASATDTPTIYILIAVGFLLFIIALITGFNVQGVKLSRKAPPLHKGKK